MANQAAATVEAIEIREAAGAPLLDTVAAAITKPGPRPRAGIPHIRRSEYALPPDEVSSKQIKDPMTILCEQRITVIESEESEEPATAEIDKAAGEARGNLNVDDIGRTDDPVRIYLREMSSVGLLSREGEVAIAKRIEAGREMMTPASARTR